MGRLIQLVGSSIGLASEAIAHHKASKSGSTTPSSRSNVQTGESSRSAELQYIPSEAPPAYVEVTDEKAAALFARGQAIPVDTKTSRNEDQYGGEEYDTETSRNEDQYSEEEYDTLSEENDEEQWALDEASTPNERDDETDVSQDPNAIAGSFLRSHPPPYTPTVGAKLPCAVIIPQRRPKDKKRGFVRAYAPVLENCGIDQAMFLDFLKNFHQASKVSPYLPIINIAAAIAGFAPSIIASAVTTAVQISVGIAMEVQRRTRTKSYLDRMNNEFFRPRGLYCLIMTYKPDSSDLHASVNISQAISSTLSSSGMSGAFSKLKVSAGKTYGELEMPEAAPLVFPALDAIADQTSEEGIKKTNKMKSSQKFVADYFDRRAQAKYAQENPGSSLSYSPNTKFANRYADPTHATNDGSLISLVSGGMLGSRRRGGGGGPINGLISAGQEYMNKGNNDHKGNGRANEDLYKVQNQSRRDLRREIRGDRRDERRERRGDRRDERRERRGDGRDERRERGDRRDERRERRGDRGDESRSNRRTRRGRDTNGNKQGLVKRFMQKDVLYMMIVNMPSEEELERGRRAVAREQRA